MAAVKPTFASCCAGLYELPIVGYLLNEGFHPGGAKLTRNLATAALIGPNSQVLDVASGQGGSARLLSSEFGATVVGCDFSRKNTALAAASRVRGEAFVNADARQLPFFGGSFDVTLCECSLCLFENTDAALHEMHRVLRPGGRIAISDFCLNAPIPDSLNNLLGQVLCVAGAPTAIELRDGLLRAGFEHVRIRPASWALETMIQRIRRRLRVLSSLPETNTFEWPDNWGDPIPVLDELERFIALGGAGYLTATARRCQD